MSNRFYEMYESFMERYPIFERDTVDWYPIGKYELLFELIDGSRLVYNTIRKTVRHFNPNAIDDDELWAKEFASRLRTRIIESGLTLEELEEESGVSRKTVQRYLQCSNKPTLLSAMRLAKALGCTLAEFTYYE